MPQTSTSSLAGCKLAIASTCINPQVPQVSCVNISSAQNQPYAKTDAIYTATDQLNIPGLSKNIPGGGLFNQFHSQLQLTMAGQQRSQWQFPEWFWPKGSEPSLSYHRRRDRWQRQGNQV